jgi:hypothetical protein
MVREHLSDRMKAAGRDLLAVTDALEMRAQGAMWLYDHSLKDWRFYIVTSLVDVIGRRKTYQLLLEAFERIDLPEDVTIEDVYLGSPTDLVFQYVSRAVGVSDDSQVTVNNCSFDGLLFDGVIYRSVKAVPSAGEAKRIERRFSGHVKNLPRRVETVATERV